MTVGTIPHGLLNYYKSEWGADSRLLRYYRLGIFVEPGRGWSWAPNPAALTTIEITFNRVSARNSGATLDEYGEGSAEFSHLGISWLASGRVEKFRPGVSAFVGLGPYAFLAKVRVSGVKRSSEDKRLIYGGIAFRLGVEYISRMHGWTPVLRTIIYYDFAVIRDHSGTFFPDGSNLGGVGVYFAVGLLKYR